MYKFAKTALFGFLALATTSFSQHGVQMHPPSHVNLSSTLSTGSLPPGVLQQVHRDIESMRQKKPVDPKKAYWTKANPALLMLLSQKYGTFQFGGTKNKSSFKVEGVTVPVIPVITPTEISTYFGFKNQEDADKVLKKLKEEFGPTATDVSGN